MAILTDRTVDGLYGDSLEQQLEAQGFTVRRLVMEAGEDHKNLETFGRMVRACADFGMTRSDLVITLGGGVPGDLGGFVAASFLRGVDFIQIPTTLLAQIDSSVGGKVAVDLPEGKNLVGAFYQPKGVLMDPELLRSLDRRYLHDGLAEVIKCAAFGDPELFAALEQFHGRGYPPACDGNQRCLLPIEGEGGGRRRTGCGGPDGAEFRPYHRPCGGTVLPL